MSCDGKNPNCDRRRELLAQLKCLISSMDRKKPCEWDEPFPRPIVHCPVELPLCIPTFCESIKPCKSFDFRSSIMYKCECIKRNGLQDRCMMWNCMGRPECMTKLYPICEPGRAALLKLTDLGDVDVALRKFYRIDQARENALATYCKLISDVHQKFLPCGGNNDQNMKALYIPSNARNNTLNCIENKSDRNFSSKPIFCSDSSLYRIHVSSPAYPGCIPQLCCISQFPFYKLKESSRTYDSPLPACSPFCSPTIRLPYVQCCLVT